MSRRSAGFTLIEIMVSIGILSTITLMLWASSQGAFRTKKGVEGKMARYRVARLAMDRILRDVQMAYLSNNAIPGTEQTPRTYFDGVHRPDIDELRFTYFGHQRLYAESKEGDTAAVGYFGQRDKSDGGKLNLWRKETRRLIAERIDNGNIPGEAEVIADDVVKLELPGHVSMVRPVVIRGGLIHELTAQLPPRRVVPAAKPETTDRQPTNWSRGFRYTAYVFYGLAAVSTLAALGTWRSYVGAEDRANAYLDQLQRDLTSAGTVGNYRDFFTSSAQLSSCAPQTGLGASAAYQGYLSECQSGNSLARATTGLWITTASLVALGVTSTIISAVIRRPEPKRHPDKPAAPGDPVEITPPPPPAPRLQLDGVAPVVTPTGGGAVLSLSF